MVLPGQCRNVEAGSRHGWSSGRQDGVRRLQGAGQGPHEEVGVGSFCSGQRVPWTGNAGGVGHTALSSLSPAHPTEPLWVSMNSLPGTFINLSYHCGPGTAQAQGQGCNQDHAGGGRSLVVHPLELLLAIDGHRTELPILLHLHALLPILHNALCGHLVPIDHLSGRHHCLEARAS